MVYATFRGHVRDHVPVAGVPPRAAAAAFARFVAANAESTEHAPQSVAHVAGRWRRAACLPGDVCICIHECVCVCVCVCTHARTHAHTHTDTYTQTDVWLCVCTCVRVCVYVCVGCMCV